MLGAGLLYKAWVIGRTRGVRIEDGADCRGTAISVVRWQPECWCGENGRTEEVIDLDGRTKRCIHS